MAAVTIAVVFQQQEEVCSWIYPSTSGTVLQTVLHERRWEGSRKTGCVWFIRFETGKPLKCCSMVGKSMRDT